MGTTCNRREVPRNSRRPHPREPWGTRKEPLSLERQPPPSPPPSHDVPEPCPSALLKEMGSPSTPRPQTRMMQPHITMIMPQEGIQEGVVGWFWLEYRHWSVLSLWAFITATAGTYQLHLESESWNCHQLWRSLSLWEFFFFSIPKIAFFQPLLWHSH